MVRANDSPRWVGSSHERHIEAVVSNGNSISLRRRGRQGLPVEPNTEPVVNPAWQISCYPSEPVDPSPHDDRTRVLTDRARTIGYHPEVRSN